MSNYIPDCIFPTDNEAEIPMLRLDVQPESVNIPFLCFGEQKRTYEMNNAGTLHFYTDDYRFSVIYDHPDRILAHHPGQIVEPNFSLFNEMPVAFGFQAIYKKRWIARAMQERGIPVFVDLNVAGKFYQMNMIGVPMGYRAFCTRGYSDRLHYLEYEYNIAKEWSGGNPLFVIYGGGIECKRFAREHNCIYITPVVTLKQKGKSRQMIEDNIAMLGPEFAVDKMLPKDVNIFENQIADYSKTALEQLDQ